MSTQLSQLSFFQPDLPSGLKYLPDFVSVEEAGCLIHKLDAQSWRSDLKRRVQHYGYRYDYKARQAREEDYLGPLPPFLQGLAEHLTHAGHFGSAPDQVIVNEYMPGQGISAHVDCRPCFGDVIASLSLLSPCVMRLENRKISQQVDLTLEPGSLLVLSGEARHVWTHAIPARKSDIVNGQTHPRSRRLSLTFREMRFV
ncbi:alpha-ketoglutarate-dependent dioxygenase AlkB [Thalassobius sp. Cn5-15]|uniref:alpha-ketoglutarate-dependent dioxygenase AlkB n=1 Tax=Thalassobius sp. Cn5-15 TaxID=2917763 RepID=UPI001EF1FFF9|nr:alpha-ketoglutarate-dependent dioxygenase AlkB [Thalassobius sp. Cn5-15]MCG7493054.1 alpha-ketoglutarate-dependent dioxygenase AlkB [Thalassobius sp. Cn5-15]